MSRITKWDKQAIVKAIMADVPMPDKKKRKQELQTTVVKAMSPEARKLYKNCPEALRTQCIGELIYDGTWSSRDIIVGDVQDKTVKEFIAKYEAEDQKVSDARWALKNAIEACTTIKQLNDRLPEFKKYFPTVEKPTANLPALANVVADLSKLGWPKGSK
jgi:Nucleotide modification associated domain 5